MDNIPSGPRFERKELEELINDKRKQELKAT